MRVKPLPEPPEGADGVRTAWRAVPLVPADEADCCVRLAGRLDLDSEDEARRWLTLLRGLGLVSGGGRGFRRVRDDPDPDALAEAFLSGVFGAREVRAALDDDPRDSESVFAAFEPHVPPWERAKRPGAWREVWRGRTERLLDWLVLLDLAEREREGYVRA